MTRFRRLFRLTTGRRTLRDSVDDEIRLHIDLRTAQFMRRGMTEEQARAEALRRFGGTEGFHQARERLQHSATRREGRLRMRQQLDAILRDVSYAWRGLRQHRGFTAAAVLTVALCVGATTAIFGVVNAVLLRPLPYAQPDRVVMVWNHWTNWPRTWLSSPEAADYAKRREVFADFAPYSSTAANLTGDGEPERVPVGLIPANFLPVLGVAPIAGRVFTAEEDRPNGPAAALLDYGLWQRRYGGDRSIVGRKIELNGVSTPVVGILPPGFRLPDEFAGDHAQVYRPLQLGPVDENERGSHYLLAVGRLADGVSVQQANTRLAAAIDQMKREHPNNYGPEFGATLVPMPDQVFGSSRKVLLLLLGAVGFVLLIGCANVASLLLSRAESRQREIAVRSALGAGRQRLARQFLTESLLLGLLGGVIALPLAVWGAPLLVRIGSRNLPRADATGFDISVLVFAFVTAVITSLLFGIAPALHALRGDLNATLRTARTGSTTLGGVRLRQFIVTVQIALAVISVSGAALMMRSFASLLSVSPGFRPDHVLTMRLSLPALKYRGIPAVQGFYTELVGRVRSLPGVRSAGAINALPLTGTIGDWSVLMGGRPEPKHGEPIPSFDWQVATPGYFDAMAITIKQGRAFTDADRRGAAPVMIIGEATARKYWPNANPIGSRVRLGGTADSVWREIIGIAADVRHQALDKEIRPEMYLPHAQFPSTMPDTVPAAPSAMTLVIRTANEPTTMVADVRAAIRQMDPTLPVANVRTLDNVLAASVSTPRLATFLLGSFGALALVLSAIGVYGVMAYSVARRTGEIGIRIALGARTGDVLRLVVRQGMWPAVVGLALGAAAALAAARFMLGLVFGVSPTDAVSIVVSLVVLGLVALAATILPARRGVRVDPAVALRAE